MRVGALLTGLLRDRSRSLHYGAVPRSRTPNRETADQEQVLIAIGLVLALRSREPLYVGCLMTQTIFEAAGGHQALLNLAHAWHERCLDDPIVSHAFSHGYHPQHTERLAAYWTEALGGPSAYTDSLGNETNVVRLHSGNGEHREMDERAQTCFALALDDADLPDDPRLRSTLKAYFRWATERMSAYPQSPDDVPGGLTLTRWSWNGPAQS